MDLVHCVQIDVPSEDVPVLEEMVFALGLVCSSWRNVDTGEAWLRVFADDEEKARADYVTIEAGLEDWGAMLSAPCSLELKTIYREDWSECWKKHFHTFRASTRLVVKPSWEEYTKENEGDIVLELDPGMSFGTGYHGTTRACLEFLDDLSLELGAVSFLEAGCGSGILSLAGMKLGFSPVYGFDNDPEAVRCARENLAAAGVAGVQLGCAELGAYCPGREFRVVAANILAHVLEKNAAAVSGFVAADGYLILAGILTEQYAGIKSCYEALGFREVRNRCIDEWTSGLFVRN